MNTGRLVKKVFDKQTELKQMKS